MSEFVHELLLRTAAAKPRARALTYLAQTMDYGTLAAQVRAVAAAYHGIGLGRGERVAVYLEKRFETVVAMFGAAAAGGVFVPVNPLLKAEQVAYILADCNVRILVTSADRLRLLAPALAECPDLETVVVVGTVDKDISVGRAKLVAWDKLSSCRDTPALPRIIDIDMAAILYTSGSTGKPKGVVLSHRNMVAGAKSVSSYLENTADDRLLAVLPLSFDYGLSQLTTAFHVGASVVLLNHLLPQDVVRAVEEEGVTGLAAVPPLWIQLSQQKWPARTSLRYITNSGGAMTRTTLDALRRVLPETKVFLMYGLTEAFRSTYLPPDQIDLRPDSIGKAIPNAEVMVLREDGSPCAPGEPGELVHRGALVSMGYWNDVVKTAERFKPVLSPHSGLPLPELAVWSGDTVRMDDAGYLYFISRKDEMIKTSGYRVSPTEVEEVLYATGLVAEAAAFGMPHPVLGQAITVVAVLRDGQAGDGRALIDACKAKLPAYMLPSHVEIRCGSLPRNPNGKIDRKLLAQELTAQRAEAVA
ncbi:acyl-CoA ligase (AMP-forming), exosortase A system-associated [Noviherbaspirillum galbum]|uniref:Acyl-CoA ligase (AMP-forming), exosortase A system-associated n=1 Tax=Noviherbaspirillum galbum TaxID=2709383 RepID=A0A6B3SY21_9BURK|nr:acyl-CoA ligase (AMP-forming), exosortase A system-associated [Noviherbaspirillum galbum]NEX64136.1 acyl-CoA ligase (AMP-forming), exosortase A system-associated [Noviherbaspirillum galbum]